MISSSPSAGAFWENGKNSRTHAGHPEGSILGNVFEEGDGDHFGASQQDLGAIAADAESDGVVDVDLAGRLAVAEVVKVGVEQFEEVAIDPDEPAETDIGRTQVDDHKLADHRGQQRRRVVGHGFGNQFGGDGKVSEQEICPQISLMNADGGEEK